MSNGYAHPEVLVSTQWVADHLNDPNVRIAECDEGRAAVRDGAYSERRQAGLAH
ncbi:MAG: hypothetical protein KatS3mg061_2228 [Dehalococcoidia bacterium]|nr:MAG: hypothetical protein KatS3mg061_2228 [Dehalococcoidia bacterium]